MPVTDITVFRTDYNRFLTNQEYVVQGDGIDNSTIASFTSGNTIISTTFHSPNILQMFVDVDSGILEGSYDLELDNGGGDVTTVNNAMVVNGTPVMLKDYGDYSNYFFLRTGLIVVDAWFDYAEVAMNTSQHAAPIFLNDAKIYGYHFINNVNNITSQPFRIYFDGVYSGYEFEVNCAAGERSFSEIFLNPFFIPNGTRIGIKTGLTIGPNDANDMGITLLIA